MKAEATKHFGNTIPYSSRILNVLNTTDDFPTIKMNISELSLPAVGWQSLISKRVINHYFVLGSWIKNLVAFAKYANVPLCNLQIENIGFLVDIDMQED